MGKNYEKYSKDELINLLEKQAQALALSKCALVWDVESESERAVEECKNKKPVLKLVQEKTIKLNEGESNLLIEGENYHALKALEPVFSNEIDMIYIDPPYNTGKRDFVYNDKYIDKNDGYRHSKWLSFMEKRLVLAKELLKDSGVIFISIDDYEQANLTLLCNKVFGEVNRIATLPTVMNLKGNQDEFGFAGTHEYTLVYAKNKEFLKLHEFEIEDTDLEGWQIDDIGYFKKGAILKRTGTSAPREHRPYGWFPLLVDSEKSVVSLVKKREFLKLYNPKRNEFDDVFLEKLKEKYENLGFSFILPYSGRTKTSWRWSYDKIKNEAGEILVEKIKNKLLIHKKQRPLLGEHPTKKPKTVFYKSQYCSGNGTNRLKEILGENTFSNPKPLELIKDFIKIGASKNALILDFMAGSGTTADAVLTLNKEDGGNRRFILCTNNENSICENICYPRVKKVIEGYEKQVGEGFVEGLGGNLEYFRIDIV